MNSINSTTARDILARFPPPAECLALLVGFAELSLFGLGGLANPLEFAKGYGLPPPPSDVSTVSSTSKTKEDAEPTPHQRALIAAIAARNVQNGLCLLAFGAYWRDRRALGTLVASGLITTVADTVLVHWYGERSAVWGHLIGVANSVLIGGALLFL